MTTVIAVTTRDDYADGAGLAMQHDLAAMDLPVQSATSAKLYRIDAEYSAEQFEQLAAELLADRVTETWQIDPQGTTGGIRLEIWLKPAVTDTVAESVAHGIAGLGLPPARDIRTGEAYVLAGDFDAAALERAALRTRINPVIHRWQIQKP
jgi:phosphoribosylformylglycinamidine (FGAM) synthase PurS component